MSRSDRVAGGVQSGHEGGVVLPITSGGNFARTAGFAVPLTGAGIKTTGIVRCDRPRALDLGARSGRKLESVPGRDHRLRSDQSSIVVLVQFLRGHPARRPFSQKSASLRQHPLDSRSKLRNTGIVIAVSPKDLAIAVQVFWHPKGAMLMPMSCRPAPGLLPLRRAPRDSRLRSCARIPARRILARLGALLYNGFRSATASATVFAAIYAGCSMCED